jgi:hypothetical protein
MIRKQMSHVLLALVILIVPLGFMSCSKSQLEASANDVLSVVTNAELINALQVISPGAVAQLAKLVPEARALILAIQNGNTTNAAQIIATIFPVIEQIAAVIINLSSAGMAILAIANIALHFLLNHLPASPVMMATSPTFRKLTDYKNQRAWGCDFHAKDRRCKQ